MKRAGNCLMCVAILTAVDIFIMFNISKANNYGTSQQLSNIEQGYKAIIIIGLLQVVLLFIAGASLKNDNTIIRRLSRDIIK